MDDWNKTRDEKLMYKLFSKNLSSGDNFIRSKRDNMAIWFWYTIFVIVYAQ